MQDALVVTDGAELAGWAASGAMALTGRPDQAPLGPPRGLVTRLSVIGAAIDQRAAQLDGRVRIDPLALLGERAAIAGLSRRGPVSCGGTSRLLPTRDGWMAVSLARPDDRDLVAAWVERVPQTDDVWDDITTVTAALDHPAAAALVERAALLGLPVAVVPDRAAHREPPSLWSGLPLRATEMAGAAGAATSIRNVRVIDLSSLWAGPLCGAILAQAGADVIKVESTGRPDGARGGPAQFFDLLNGAKRSVALDLAARSGIAVLHSLIAQADVVIEASRPRALEQLGVRVDAVLAGPGRTQVWVSITGHGRTGPDGNRVAFGDDAAVAGGLVAWDDRGPCFCADAIADPTSGLVATAAALEALARGGRWLVDVSMAGVAAHLAGPTIPADQSFPVAQPAARVAVGAAPSLGEHTTAVLDDLAVAD